MSAHQCSVGGCGRRAAVVVFLYDVYLYGPNDTHVFMAPDFTCPYLCALHLYENETQAEGVRANHGEAYISYPFTNRYKANGFSVYGPLEA